ncbi:MAG TPA: hypothetical protein VF779_19305 [Pyrinomonadaceae bacterium]
MEEAYKQFADAFAHSILRLDFSAAHKMLAPWLKDEITPERLRLFVETELKEVAAGFDLEEIIYPKAYHADGNSCSLDDLRSARSYITSRRSNESIPTEVTEENFRKWMVIQFTPAPEGELEMDAWFDFWMMLVEVGGEYRIGYFEFEDPD